jgi:hypothetical protein
MLKSFFEKEFLKEGTFSGTLHTDDNIFTTIGSSNMQWENHLNTSRKEDLFIIITQELET